MSISNEEIRKKIFIEFKKGPEVNNMDGLEVTVDEGVVTLSGQVDSYMDQQAAELSARKVPGVKVVVQKINVQASVTSQQEDETTAQDANQTFDLDIDAPHDRVKAVVKDGWVALEGEVDWQYEKEEIESAVSKISGIKGVSNNITVKPPVTVNDLQSRIRSAFQTTAAHRASHINVEVQNGNVVLTGEVRAWIEKAIAEAACSVDGVQRVENKLTFHPLLEGKELVSAEDQEY